EIYVNDFGGGWRQSPGAITWLRRTEAATKIRRRKSATATGPSAGVKKRLLQLPQQFGAEWQASVRQPPTWVGGHGLPQRPWSILVIDSAQQLVVAQDMVTSHPTPEKVFDLLAQGMERPLIGTPHRPREIQVLDDPIWEAIRPDLEEIGVDCIFRAELD